MPTLSLPVRDAVALFSDHNQAEGKSPQTDAWYRRQLGAFAAWLEARGPATGPATVGELSIPLVERYTVEQRRRTARYEGHPFAPRREGPLSSHSVQAGVRALRAFATWLHRAGYTDENVLAALRPPRTHRAVVDTLTDDEVQRLLAAIDRTTAVGVRDYALVVTYLDTGARCGELLTMSLEDVHLDEGWLLLDGKGNKERMVGLGASARAALRLWARQGRPRMAREGCPFFFVDARAGGPLSTSAVEQRIAALGSRSLPGRRVYCHLLRHTFATSYLVYGLGDELHLMATLGHTTLVMVRHYVDKAKFLKALRERQGSVMDTLAGARPRGRPRKRGAPLWAARRAG
jgi:site-specific recombinase XerD